MSSTGLEVFDETIQKTNTLLKRIEAETGWEGRRSQSYALLRSVLHTLRDRLTIEEIAQMGAQFPILVRGIYYEGWDPSVIPKKVNKEQFLLEVRAELPMPVEEDIEDLVRAVLIALSSHVSPGEVGDIISVLPKDIASLFEDIV